METSLLVGYIRISREDNNKANYSPELQRATVTEYVSHEFADVPHELVFYEDLGLSGAYGLRQHADLFPQCRPGLSDAVDLLVAEARRRPVHLLCLDQSRLERNPLVWEVLKERYLKPNGIELHLLSEGGQAEFTPEGDLVRRVSSAANANYRAQVGRRQAESHRHRAQQGYVHGVPAYGWRRVPKAEGEKWYQIEPIPEQCAAILAMRDKLLAGWGSWRIARWLDDQCIASPSAKTGWYPETVRAVLRNPIHAGLVMYEGDAIRGRHFEQRLWDAEFTHELDRLITQQHRAKRRGLKLGEFMLAGLVSCGHCGGPLAAVYDSKTGKRHYVCAGRRVPAANSHRGVSKLAEIIERAVTNTVHAVLDDGCLQALTVQEVESAMAAELAELKAREARQRQRLEEARKDLAHLLAMHRRGEVSDLGFQETQRQYEADLEQAHAELDHCQERRRYLAGDEVRIKRAQEAARDLPRLWKYLDTEERRGLLQALLEEIVVTRDGPHLKLAFRFHFLGARELILRSVRGCKDGPAAERLTLRELAFLHLWQRGLRYPEVAACFGVGEPSARQHGHCIRRKLEVDDLDEAVAIAHDQIELNLPYLPVSGRAHKVACDHPLLGDTELRVLQGLASGPQYREVAAAQGITLCAAYNAAYAARKKLNVKTNLEAAEKARQLGALAQGPLPDCPGELPNMSSHSTTCREQDDD